MYVMIIKYLENEELQVDESLNFDFVPIGFLAIEISLQEVPLHLMGILLISLFWNFSRK